jgi:hypothetical protein
MRRVLDYIDAHLTDALWLVELAAIAGLSPWSWPRIVARVELPVVARKRPASSGDAPTAAVVANRRRNSNRG